mmetsp:Transcript_13127/g.11208  ORF Transcript_13127/g.11208 Transcript_13127/m.11208 type:complete len:143 (-) Transcript_13127:57-485(-)
MNKSKSVTQSLLPQNAQEDASLLDDALDQIGFGQYQRRMYIILSLVLMNDGAESIIISFLLPILQKEWGLQTDEMKWLGSAMFTGFLIGSIVSGFFADRFGRKNTLIYVVIALYIVAMLSAFVQNYWQVVLTRSLYTLLVGI